MSLPREVEGFFQVIKQAMGAGRSLVRRHDMQLCSSLKMCVANSSHRKHKMEERNSCIREGSRSSVLQTHPTSLASKFTRCQETQAQRGCVETVVAILGKVPHVPVCPWQHSRPKGAGWKKEDEVQGVSCLFGTALSSG